jgi:release factor glutamine methyltransferase
MTTTIAQAMAQAKALGLARLDAQLLLSHHLQRPRPWLLAHDDAVLSPALHAKFLLHCRQRLDDVPLAYLLGEREFFGLALKVNPAVLVPRPDTETLVEWALDILRATPKPKVLDLGTGSGAIALALACTLPSASICATDASSAALAVAQANGLRLGLAVDWRLGSWWEAVPQSDAFDVVVSNPPYIAAGDTHLPSLRHEPRMALTPEGNGLSALHSIVQGALAHLRPQGWLLLEHGADQADAVASMLNAAGFSQVMSRRDLAGHRRCTGGQWSTSF